MAAWLFAVASGFVALEVHANAPGTAASAPAHVKSEKGARLLVFIHPECPCSQATVTELDRLSVAIAKRCSTTVYVFAPRTKSRAWATGDLYQRANRIANTTVILDEDGAEARRLGVRTSGQTLFYDQEGRLVFSGGITPSRGHEGDSPGRDAILTWLTEGEAAVQAAPVFGCSFGFEQKEIQSQ